MPLNTRRMVGLLAGLLASLIALSGAFSLPQGEAATVQVQSQSDAKPKNKPSSQPAPTANLTAPANDNCADAVAVSSCPFTDTKITSGATLEPGEPASCSLIGATVWYTYTNPSSKPVIVTVSSCSSNFDTVLAVYRVSGGACDFAGFTAVACSDDAFNCGNGLQSATSFAADPYATYKLQAGGFNGQTGTLVISVECQEVACDARVANGTLGSGDPSFANRQFSGLLLGRLARDGAASMCAMPKPCNMIDFEGLRAFDAYEFPNDSSQAACVSVNLRVTDRLGCNLQADAYLDSFDPNAICAGYLGDPGLSSGSNPPSPTNLTVIVPAGHTLIVVVHSINFDEGGCRYALTVTGNLCFDTCVQDDANPARFIRVSLLNGDYEYHDCDKGVVLRGRGAVALASPPANCKFVLDDAGPQMKRPDRAVHVEVNVCTRVASASLRYPLASPTWATLFDRNYADNGCACR